MTVREKLEVLELVWEDLRKNVTEIPTPEWHREVLERRLNAVEKGQMGYTDWETAKGQIRRKCREY